MTKPAKHTRIPILPYINSLLGSRLVSFYEEAHGRQHDFVVNYHELCPLEPPQVLNRDGNFVEWVRGHYLPRRLRFYGVQSVECEGLYTRLDELPLDHPVRSLRGVLSWIPRDGADLFSLFAHGAEEPAKLWVTSRGCIQEECSGEAEPVELIRDWSPPPPFNAGLIREPKRVHQCYGGDPVTIKLGARTFHRRLFVGSLDYQTEQRPLVDAVLNVGEEPSRWVKKGEANAADRWIIRGEGSQGMGLAELVEEANWVIDRLRQGQCVLVHCVAGLNRSTTVCCAVLILLEGLTAEAALERVREHHGWARPDGQHWLVLKGLAQSRIR